MDPLSIAASATALAAFAFKTSALIYTTIESTKSVDATISQLHSEVDSLATSLQNIGITFQSSEVLALLSKGAKDKVQPAAAAKLLGSVKPILDDCERSLEVLGLKLKGIDTPGSGAGGKAGTWDRLLRKPRMVVKLHFAEGELEGLRHQIRSYCGAMQMTLLMVGICLTLDGKTQVESLGNSLNMQLSNLSEQMASVQKQLSQYRKTSNSSKATRVQDKIQKQHLQQHVRIAELVFSNATEYAGSLSATIVEDSSDIAQLDNVFGSVMGINEEQRRRIGEWIPWDGAILEEGRPLTDDEDDMDTHLFKTRVSIAEKSLKDKHYILAVSKFEACLVGSLALGNRPQHEVFDLQIQLATAYRGTKETAKQRGMLHALLELELTELQTLHVKHALGVAYFDNESSITCSDDLHKSRKHTEDALRGCRKLLGSRHTTYHKILYLLAEICDALKDLNSAEVYRHLLPSGYRDNPSGDLVDLGFGINDPKSHSSAIKETVNLGFGINDPKSHFSAIKETVDLGFGINAPKSHFTAIKQAISSKNFKALQLLLESGVKIESNMDGEKETFIYDAVKQDAADEVVQLLINAGADMNSIASDGVDITALIYVARGGNTSKVNLLLRNGAGVDVLDGQKTHALAWASFFGKEDIVLILLDAGSDVNHVNIIGEACLYAACEGGHTDVALLLIQRGATLNHTKCTKVTALMVAAEGGHLKVVRLLADHGASTTMKDREGQTALEKAKKNGHSEVVQFLESHVEVK